MCIWLRFWNDQRLRRAERMRSGAPRPANALQSVCEGAAYGSVRYTEETVNPNEST